MTEQAAYKVLQEAWVKKYGAEVGDEVMVTKANMGDEYGSRAVWHDKNEIDVHGWTGWKISHIARDCIHITNHKGKNFITSIFSLGFISKEEKVKEVTMADLEAKYGCKIKVVK